MFISTTKTPKFQVSASLAPRIVISQKALSKMHVYVDECSDEIGWLGTADLHVFDGERVVVIDDTFLPQQEVHSTTTELTPEGLSEIAMELLAQPDGDKVWNRMRMWGHSHVNMGTSPSGQDDKQMKEFSTIGHEWFVRLIANKKGDIRVDFYDYQAGITILDLNWETLEQEDAVLKDIHEQINALQEQIDALESAAQERRDMYLNSIKPDVVLEMKEKVKKKVYTSNWHKKGKSSTSSGGSESWNRGHGAYGNMYDYYDDFYRGGDSSGTGAVSYNDDVYLSSTTYPSETLDKKKQLNDYFNDTDAIELACVNAGDDLEEFIRDSGYSQTFTREEAEQLRELAIKHYSKYIGA